MSTFPRFADLPRELRDMVWSQAIRSPSPGAHIFRLYDSQHDVTEPNSLKWKLGPYGQNLALPWSHQYHSSVNEFGESTNSSTYQIDGGLWTACKESRLVMKSHFQTPELSGDTSHMPVTRCFLGDALQYFTVLPHRDLLILQAHDLGLIDWSAIAYHFPFCPNYLNFGKGMHIGIEYDPDWSMEVWSSEDPEDSRTYRALLNAAWECGAASRIWLIDYDLKRKDNAAMRSETSVFHASDGKFIEIKSLEGWECIEPVDGDDESYDDSSFELVRSLNGEYEGTVLAGAFGLLGWDYL
ncbi:hypothetical protein FHETE_5300 [Fusarium heterosporum]|uniref:2EXR domain-containing protein n=1 Tax=Fusarium heterosporum TaxID=42747 RepID=A0A8H5T9Y7_FUSHE|nr:hypothetical protein FHETE_5300 [Fusarium heterosporum]